MSNNIIQIPLTNLITNSKSSYEEYENYLVDIKGFCTTIEQILAIYRQVTKDEILDMKETIFRNISFRKKQMN